METVLLVDDDATCRDSMRRVFEREGYSVQAAPDVDSALSTIAEGPPDLIVCDNRMSGKSGIDFLRELQERGMAIPVLLVSAWIDDETEVMARQFGASGLLHKPVTRRQLLDKAARSLEHKAGGVHSARRT